MYPLNGKITTKSGEVVAASKIDITENETGWGGHCDVQDGRSISQFEPIRLELEDGRTGNIRVHFAVINSDNTASISFSGDGPLRRKTARSKKGRGRRQ